MSNADPGWNMVPPLRGRVELATYIDPLVPFYRGNPMIEALPRIWEKQEAAQLLMHYPAYNEEERLLPSHLRSHYIRNAAQFFQPLSTHLQLEQRLSIMIREGYRARNPAEPTFWRDIRSLQPMSEKQNQGARRKRSAAVAMGIIGISGMGKSTALHEILGLYPQVIFHNIYRGRPCSFQQLVWLKLECPSNGSIKSLCDSFFWSVDSILDTNYYKAFVSGSRASATTLLVPMRDICLNHGVGVLVIDEIQNINKAASGGAQQMLNYFTELVNELGIPVVLVGTPEALSPISEKFRMARRVAGLGDLIWDQMQYDEDWMLFVDGLWTYQYVRTPTPLTPDLSEALYHVSTGITDIAVKVFMFAQRRAIDTGEESITEEVIRSTPANDLRMAERVLSAIRAKNTGALPQVSDIHLTELEPIMPDTDGSSVREQGRYENVIVSVARTAGSGSGPYDALRKAGYIRPAAEFLESYEIA